MRFRRRAEPVREAIVTERIRGVEVPVLTETKRRLLRGEVAEALRYAYPRVVADLERAYGVEFPPGFSHEEILERGFTEPMRPLTEFFDRFYRYYAPVRFGGRAPSSEGDQVLEIVRSLYSSEPMWRLYLSDGFSTAPPYETAPTETAREPAP
ncbi:MAG: hypothetical protein ACRECR_00215 [Thermoplasmata archaeon]